MKLAKTFSAELEILRDGKGASAKSSVKLMLLAVKEDDRIVIRGDGDDAEAAVDSLADFVSDPDAGLGAAGAATTTRPVDRVASPAAVPADGRRGIGASEGATFGAAFPFFPVELQAPRLAVPPAGVAAETERYRAALEASIEALLQSRASGEQTEQDLGIVDALIEVARDGALVDAVEARIAQGTDALSATLDAGREVSTQFELVADPYVRARAEDVRGVTRNVAFTLLGTRDVSLGEAPAGAILVAEEISAWDLAKAPLSRIAGILCSRGGATSHVAIMARTHGIPAVLGLTAERAELEAARVVALDGGTGEVVFDPSQEVIRGFEARQAREAAVRESLAAYAAVEPRTRGGLAIEVAANLGSLAEIEPALKMGAMGVGLFRTELLFMERRILPDEDEQTTVYMQLARAFWPRPVIVRTLDIGGDKPVSGIDFPKEENPFLGWRGVRMCLDRPDVFRPQLRALLRAAVVGNIKVMVPMIADVGELRAVKALLVDCRADLEAAGVPVGDIEVGVMMETPAAALMADEIAAESAFFSIGTNDLTQYVMAADRLNPRLVGLNRADHPAVLRAVELICEAAKRAGIWVGVCGEAAAREDLIPRFIKMGVTELSMSPASIPRAKRCVMEA